MYSVNEGGTVELLVELNLLADRATYVTITTFDDSAKGWLCMHNVFKFCKNISNEFQQQEHTQ